MIKRNKLSRHEKTSRNLKYMLPSGRSKYQMATYCAIPTLHSGKGQTMKTV